MSKGWVPTGHEFEEGAESPIEARQGTTPKRLLERVFGRKKAAKVRLEVRDGVGEARRVASPRAPALPAAPAAMAPQSATPPPTPELAPLPTAAAAPAPTRRLAPPPVELDERELNGIRRYVQLAKSARTHAAVGDVVRAAADIEAARSLALTLGPHCDLGQYPSLLRDIEKDLKRPAHLSPVQPEQTQPKAVPPAQTVSKTRRIRQTTVRRGVAPEVDFSARDRDVDGSVGNWQRNLSEGELRRQIGPVQNYGDDT